MMAGITARMQFLIQFMHIPPAMYDVLFPRGPILSIASKEFMIAGIVRDVSKELPNEKHRAELHGIGRDMASFASKNLLQGYEDGDDWCPAVRWPFPHHPHPPRWPWPFPGPGPDPGPWFNDDLASLNPQPLPPRYIGAVLKVLAGFTTIPKVAEELNKVSVEVGKS